MDTRCLGYKKRYGKDRRAGHKVRRSIPHIRDTFPRLAETTLLYQAQKEGAFAYQPVLTIDWTYVVPMGSIQELFKDDVAMITRAEEIGRAHV